MLVIRCVHYENDRQVPCPMSCPRQTWSVRMFRRTMITGRWKLKREYRGWAYCYCAARGVMNPHVYKPGFCPPFPDKDILEKG